MASELRDLPCIFARSGTSRGAFLFRRDLPEDPALLDRVVLAVYGSPDPRQIDGIGAGDPLTSKVAIIAPSERADADVDYTFGQVGIDPPKVYWVGNCGNMSAGVGPFAIHRGLVRPRSPLTTVRIFNTNTGKILRAHVQVQDGAVVEEGDVKIAGVHGRGAPIRLDFGDCGGAVTGRTLPTGKPRESLTLQDGTLVELSIVDASTPFVFVRSRDIGLTAAESPMRIDHDELALQRLEEVRGFAARAIGLIGDDDVATDASPSIPRVVMVGPPQDYTATDGTPILATECSVLARQLAMQRTHKTYSVTGTLCTGVASEIPGTVVHEVMQRVGDGQFHVGHPGGVISAGVKVDISNGRDIRVLEASLVRTARTIMEGTLKVPRDTWR